MAAMFEEAKSFNGDLSNWDVSNVTRMFTMFYKASSFRSNLSNWDVGNVTDMRRMFAEASFFNSDLSSWDVDDVDRCNIFSYNADSWFLPQPYFTICDPD